MHWGIHSLEKPHKSSRVLPRKYAFGLGVSRSRLGFTQTGKQLRTAEAAASSGAPYGGGGTARISLCDLRIHY